MFRFPVTTLALTGIAAVGALTAQVPINGTTAYPQDSLRGVAFGNGIPLGCSPTGLFAEGRTQILIPPQYLPNENCGLAGLAFHSSNSFAASASVTYQKLRITVSRTTATGLGTTFAGNLPLPAVLLDASNLTVNWQANAWTEIRFPLAYDHDGTSALVIDIQKIVNPVADLTTKTVQNTDRTDLPRMLNAHGLFGSGASTAATATLTANYAPAMRLLWNDPVHDVASTLKLKSDNGGAHFQQFAIGTAIEHIVQGTSGGLAIHLIGLGLQNPPQTFGGVLGQFWVNGPTHSITVIPATGENSMLVPVPATPNLVGLYLTFQSLVLGTSGLQFTNVADCFLHG